MTLTPEPEQRPYSAGTPQNNTTTVIVNSRRGTSHVFHLLMSIITGGLWIPVWIIVGIRNRHR